MPFFILKTFCSTLDSKIGELEDWRIRFLMPRKKTYSIHLYEMISNQFEANQVIPSLLFIAKKIRKIEIF